MSLTDDVAMLAKVDAAINSILDKKLAEMTHSGGPGGGQSQRFLALPDLQKLRGELLDRIAAARNRSFSIARFTD